MAGRLKIYNAATSAWEYIGGVGATLPSGAIVGTTDTQTLTNKTLTSPIIDGAGGTAAGQLGFDTTDHFLCVGDGTNNADIYVGHWKAFTPSWTNLTPGSGTNSGAYCQIGKFVAFRTCFVFGSGSAVGTTPTLTLPVGIASYPAETDIGIVTFLDNATLTARGIITNAGVLIVNKCDSTYLYGATLTASVPWTWTTNDAIKITGFYEAA